MTEQIIMAGGFIYATHPCDFFQPDRQYASGTSMESFWASLFPKAGVLKNLFLELRDTVNTQVRFTVRVNGADSAMRLYITNAMWNLAPVQLPLAGGGLPFRRFTDPATRVPIAAGDYVSYSFDAVGDDNTFRTAIVFETEH